MTVQTGCSNNVEAGLEPFFALHPTEDLNELFRALRRIDSNTWIIHTSIDRAFEHDGRDRSESEHMELWMNPVTDEVVGEYRTSFTYFKPIDPDLPPEMVPNTREVEEGERRIYPVVLTPEGIRVPEGIEIADENRERIENFRLVVQLIDLSVESRSTLMVESTNYSQNRMTTGTPSFHIGYNIEDDHPILQTIRQEFNIEDEFELDRTGRLGNLVFQGGSLRWALGESSDNTRLFSFGFRNPNEDRRWTRITSFMRVIRPTEPLRPRTEAEVIITGIENVVEDEKELNLNE